MEFSNLNYDSFNIDKKDKKERSVIRRKRKSFITLVIFLFFMLITILLLFCILSKFNAIKKIEESNRQLLNKVSEEKKQYNSVTIQVDDITNEIHQLVKDNINLKAKIKEIETEQTKQREKLDSLDDEYNNLNDSYIKKEKELRDLNKESLKYNNKRTLLKVKIPELKLSIKAHQNLIKQYENKNKVESANKYISKILTQEYEDRLNIMLKENDKSQVDDYKFKMCYSMKIHGRESKIFHNLCGRKDIKKTIALIKTNTKSVFGGYTANNWECKGYRSDRTAFLFNLKQNKIFPVSDPYKAIFSGNGYLILFGLQDLVVSETYSITEFPTSYGEEGINKIYQITDGVHSFDIDELEVFELI